MTITTPEQMREAAAQEVMRIGLEIGVTGVPVVMIAAVNAIRAIPIAPQPDPVEHWRQEVGKLHSQVARLKHIVVTQGAEMERRLARAETAEAALTIQPADPLSDPRVVALVEAARDAREAILVLLHARNSEAEGSDEDWVCDLNAALRAIGGEA